VRARGEFKREIFAEAEAGYVTVKTKLSSINADGLQLLPHGRVSPNEKKAGLLCVTKRLRVIREHFTSLKPVARLPNLLRE
jgi:hypothetical protein